MYIVLKYYLKQRELNIPYDGGIGSYLLLHMCLAAIQCLNRENRNSLNLGQCIYMFFYIFCTLNYETIFISVYGPGMLYKKEGQNKIFQLSLFDITDPVNDLGKQAYKISVNKKT